MRSVTNISAWKAVTLAAIISVAVIFAYQVKVKQERESIYLRNANYSVQTGMFDISRLTRTTIVMLGNSMTYNAHWDELLGRSDVVNRGIPNDISTGYLHRLDYVFRLSPRICFIEGGVNDVYANFTADEICTNIISIVDSLQTHGIVPVLNTTLYVAKLWNLAEEKNREITKLNLLLSEAATARNLTIIDLNPLVSEHEYLKDEMTYDGLHINAKGYSLWVQKVNDILRENGI
jgi:lysophospholipase L1-like esterase